MATADSNPFEKYQPSPAMAAWLESEKFIADGDIGMYSPHWVKCWPHSSGYGLITFRLMPIDRGWDVVLSTGHGKDRYALSIGYCNTLDDIQRQYAALSTLNYDARRSS